MLVLGHTHRDFGFVFIAMFFFIRAVRMYMVIVPVMFLIACTRVFTLTTFTIVSIITIMFVAMVTVVMLCVLLMGMVMMLCVCLELLGFNGVIGTSIGFLQLLNERLRAG
jgi:hypothetical protein